MSEEEDKLLSPIKKIALLLKMNCSFIKLRVLFASWFDKPNSEASIVDLILVSFFLIGSCEGYDEQEIAKAATVGTKIDVSNIFFFIFNILL